MMRIVRAASRFLQNRDFLSIGEIDRGLHAEVLWAERGADALFLIAHVTHLVPPSDPQSKGIACFLSEF